MPVMTPRKLGNGPYRKRQCRYSLTSRITRSSPRTSCCFYCVLYAYRLRRVCRDFVIILLRCLLPLIWLVDFCKACGIDCDENGCGLQHPLEV